MWSSCKLVPYKISKDGFALIYMCPRCIRYKIYYSIRINSFSKTLLYLFEHISHNVEVLNMKISKKINASLDVPSKTIMQVYTNQLKLMPLLNCLDNKWGDLHVWSQLIKLHSILNAMVIVDVPLGITGDIFYCRMKHSHNSSIGTRNTK